VIVRFSRKITAFSFLGRKGKRKWERVHTAAKTCC